MDEIDRLIGSVPAPDVAQRSAPSAVVDDLYRVVGPVEHYVFITTELDVAARRMKVLRIGHFTRP